MKGRNCVIESPTSEIDVNTEGEIRLGCEHTTLNEDIDVEAVYDIVSKLCYL